MSDDRIDTDAAGILIGNDMDVATAWAGSLRDEWAPQPASYGPNSFTAGIIFGVLTYWVWLL